MLTCSLEMNAVIQQIKIVDIESILPFESSLGTEAAGTDQLNLVRNPFAVLQLEENYLLLDNAEYYQTLCQAGLLHIPVQVVPGQMVSVRSETVGLLGFTPDHLMKLAAARPHHLSLENSGRAPTGFIAVHLSSSDSKTQWVHLRHASSRGCPDALTALIREASTVGSYFVMADTENSGSTVVRGPGHSFTLTLPRFTLDDLKTAALSDKLFPGGLINVSISCRVLNLDFPASVLRANISREEKQAFVHELIGMRERARKTATVDGRVYLLNL